MPEQVTKPKRRPLSTKRTVSKTKRPQKQAPAARTMSHTDFLEMAGKSPPPQSWFEEDVTSPSTPILSSEVFAFCATHRLSESLRTMLKLIQRHLAPIGKPQFTLETDPENFETYIVVKAVVSGEVPDVAKAYDAFTHDWCKAVPKLDGLIRLSLAFA